MVVARKPVRKQAHPHVPFVCNVVEADESAHLFDAVVSLVVADSESLQTHKNRLLRPFADVSNASHPNAITAVDVETILGFTSRHTGTLMVHCLAGQSRSTAVALAVMVQKGFDPVEACDLLDFNHPQGRPFTPNLLVLARFDVALEQDARLFTAGSRWCS